MFCGNCGIQLAEDGRFCTQCGTDSQGAKIVLPGRMYRVCLSALAAWTALWVGLTFAYVRSVSDAVNRSEGATLGFIFGLGLYALAWFLPAVVLSVIAVATRPTTSVPWPRSAKVAAVLASSLLFLGPVCLRLLSETMSAGHGSSRLAPTLHEVRYEVDAGEPEYTIIFPSKVNLTYHNESGGTEQTTVSIPWKLRMMCVSGSFLYISAQKGEEPWDHVPTQGNSVLWHNRAIRAAIYVDGHLLQQAQSTAAYGIAASSGEVQ